MIKHTLLVVVVCCLLALAAVVLCRSSQPSDPLDSFAYSTERFFTRIENDEVVVVSTGAAWNLNWKVQNLQISCDEKWKSPFARSNVSFFICDGTDGIEHEELADLIHVHRRRFQARAMEVQAETTFYETSQIE